MTIDSVTSLHPIYKWLRHTENAHEDGWFTRRNLLQHRQHLIHHVPPIEVLQDLSETHQAIDSHLSTKTPVPSPKLKYHRTLLAA